MTAKEGFLMRLFPNVGPQHKLVAFIIILLVIVTALFWYFTRLPFLMVVGCILMGMFLLSLLTELEDSLPGGFNNPDD